MYVRHLTVSDFRSWHSADLALEPGPSVLVGPNGQGKTNLIEALGYVATLASHRVPTDAPLVRAGAERAVVRCAVVSQDRELRVEIEISPGRANRARLNGAPAAAAARCARRAALGAVRARRIWPSSAAIPASGAGSWTSWWWRARRGWPACAPTTTGCSSSVPRC